MATIQSFAKNNYQELKVILEEAGLFDKTWDSKDNLLGMINKDPDSILVAIDDQKIVGVIYLISFGSKVAWIFRLAVKKEYRNRGIASLLIKSAENLFKEKGVVEIGMYVDAGNLELQKYYQKRNFHSSSNKPFLYLWKELTK